MGGSKRPSVSESADESKMKRAKVTMEEYEVMLGGEIYVNVDTLFKCAELHRFFFKRYKRTVGNFIKKEKLHVVCVTKENVGDGVLKVKTASYSPRFDIRVAKKDERIVRIIATAKENSHPTASSVIKTKEPKFLVDKAGVSYQVEMRGERSVNGINFKAKDVGVLSQNPCITKIIADKYTSGMTIQTSRHVEEIRELEHAYKTRLDGLKHRHKIQANKLKHAHKIQANKLEHAYKIKLDDLKSACELRVKDLARVIAIFEKQMEAIAERKRTKDLRLEKQMETEKLRLEIAQLKADARDSQIESLRRSTEELQHINEAQSVRIREFEELNRRLTKEIFEE